MIKTKRSILPAIFVGWLLTVQTWAGSLPDFTDLARENSPAVVNISSHHEAKPGKLRIPHQFKLPDLPEDSPFNDLFKRFFDQLPNIPQPESQSLGSGFIISKDGYILTNHHVVDGADTVEVRLSDRRVFDAKVIGSDKASDVALIKIDATDLPTVKIGKSSELEVGEWVLAIGSPFGFDHSVTAGIVSAKGRSLPSENYVPFIQTDVAINPGNSGGPLFNMDGEVVGINSQIYSRTGGFMGLSFAIPIELAMNVADQLRKTGHVARGYLGVLIQDVDRNLAESFGLQRPEGALVTQVMPNTPAEAAGLQPGDIIVRFNGKHIDRSSELPPLVGASPVDQDAELEVIRDGKHMTLEVRIAQLPEDAMVSQPAPQKNPGLVDKLGAVVTDLTPEARKKSKLASGGALVVRVEPQGPAQEAGMRQGDIIKTFDRQRVKNAAHLRSLVENASGTVAALILREGQPLFVAIRLGG
ncbi:MAG: DegQ family serine endoprotease [Gammaproteobacteria bacterium]|nr:MAG: DegQ family serine endoprotease [Gammaproteobacteria bacterium]